MSNTRKPKLMLTIAIVAVLLLVVPIGGCGELSPEQELQSQKISAFVMTHGFVSDRLTSPGTAKFPSFTSRHVSVTYLEDNRYLVEAYVDSQNAFGGIVRSSYLAEMLYLGDDRWRLNSLEFF